jgi:predicted dehydrogenase
LSIRDACWCKADTALMDRTRVHCFSFGIIARLPFMLSTDRSGAAGREPWSKRVLCMPNARTPKRVGLVGYGLAGAVFHAPLIATTPGLTLDAIVTRDRERRAQASRDLPGARIFDSAEELWHLLPPLDLIVIATPNRTHVPIARAALDAGIAVVVDKPLAPTAKEGRALVEEAQRRGLLLTVFQNRRWDGDFLTLRRLATAGSLGTIFRFESRFERWRPTPKVGWREQGDPREAGGVLYDLGSHLIDQALTLLGPAVSVYAELDRRREHVQVDDDAFVALTHQSGARSRLVMSAVAAREGPRFRVLGTRAAYVKWGLDPQEDALRRGQRPAGADWGTEPRARWGSLGAGDSAETIQTDAGAYPVFYAAVAAALADGTPPPVDPNDSVTGLAIIEAARRSATERLVIPLDRVNGA